MTDLLYYRVTGSPALDFCSDFRDEWRKIEKAWGEYAESKGGIGHVRLGDRSFGGVVFGRAPSKEDGWKRYRWTCRDGTAFYVPVRSGEGKEAGKALQTEFDALPQGPRAEDICEVIGFPKIVETANSTMSVVSMFTPIQIAWPDADAGVFFEIGRAHV